jgi:hypothetical protein
MQPNGHRSAGVAVFGVARLLERVELFQIFRVPALEQGADRIIAARGRALRHRPEIRSATQTVSVDAPGQGHLFELHEPGGAAVLPEEPAAADRAAPPAPRKRKSRKPDYDRLPQIRIDHDVPESEKVCNHCGEPKTRIGQDEARMLEFIPAHLAPFRDLALASAVEPQEVKLPTDLRIAAGSGHQPLAVR